MFSRSSETMDHDEDAYPNFGNAFPTQSMSPSTAAASWHPALRDGALPNEADDDDFYARYPGATPKKGDAALGTSQGTGPGFTHDETDSALRRHSISVEQTVDVQHSTATQAELEDTPAHQVDVEGPASRQMSMDVDNEREDVLALEETPIFNHGGSIEEQEIALAEPMPYENSQTMDKPESGIAVTEPESIELDHIVTPSDHYEHQGEVTEMEEAQDPDPQVSLLENEEPLPTSDDASRAPSTAMANDALSSGFNDSATPLQPVADPAEKIPAISRSFTTNFAESPSEPARRPSSSTIHEWPSFGDDKTFGEILEKHESPGEHKEALQQSAAQEAVQEAAPDLDLLPEDEGEIPEEDLAAAWGAVLDDEDILEDPSTDIDPSELFGEGDDDFLEHEPAVADTTQKLSQQTSQQRSTSTTQYRPPNIQPAVPQDNPYGVPSPQMFSQGFHGRSAGTPSTGLYDMYSQHDTSSQPQRPTTQQAQSFADKSKGGYQSPYDLPMEVVKPRRRQQQQQPMPMQAPAPPPRTSSFGSGLGHPPDQIGLPNSASMPTMSPPSSRGSIVAKSSPRTGSGFFEDLPVTSRPRARPAASYGPQAGIQGMPTPPLQGSPISPPNQSTFGGIAPGQSSRPQNGPVLPPQTQSQQFTVPRVSQGLQRAEAQPLFPDQPAFQAAQSAATQSTSTPASQYLPGSQQSTLPAPPPAQSRYSPAPNPVTQGAVPASSRYSPAPTFQPAQNKRNPSLPTSGAFNVVQPSHSFAPRTSSPLAGYTDKPHPPLPVEAQQSRHVSAPAPSPPKTTGRQSRTNYAPDTGYMGGHAAAQSRIPAQSNDFGPPLQMPPQRPRTQSPDTTLKGPRVTRPTSAGVPPASQPENTIRGPILPHRRQFSRELSFVQPQDERNQDPLQRWRGQPIFRWNAGGTILHSFPKRTPFYASGQSLPALKCTSGSIHLEDATAFVPLDEQSSKFPGPLAARSKGRKKDVMAWMTSKIDTLEASCADVMLDFNASAGLKKRTEEKLVLWNIMRIFVENDGLLEGNPKIEQEVRRVLLPNLSQMAQIADLQSPMSATVQRDPVDKQIVLQLRQALLEGQRERAVWLAEEKRLWGHAMLIASTMGPETWRQIVQAFVRNQVKSFGSDTRSMAALYQVFAGNTEECVDELVPPSARAGFQMISKTDGSASGNPLEGLDQWRETLALVTSNRTVADGQSLVSLGKMLANYGRVEAAHTCYLFARQHVKHSGADDTDAHFVLLGGNHQSSEESLGSDLDTILLTEIYEYALSLSAPSTGVAYIPHLQAFKLVHAQELAVHGLKGKAQSYCESITSAYTSTTRPSPYYHPVFTQAVADTMAFLSQTPHDGKSGGSLFSRPAMGKISSGAGSWFSKFVAGDDDQSNGTSGSTGSGGETVPGPFGGVNGDSGSISRTGSSMELPNSDVGASFPAQYAPTAAPSRYTPGLQQAVTNKYSPNAASSMPAAEPQRPSSSRYSAVPSSASNLGVPAPNLVRRASENSIGGSYIPISRRGSAQDSVGSQSSYEPKPIFADEGSANSYSPPVGAVPMYSPAAASPLVLAQEAPNTGEPANDFEAPEPLNVDAPVGNDDAEASGGYIPPSSAYEPPSYSYQPYEPEPDSPDNERPRPKPKTFGDDEDGATFATKSTVSHTQKADADRAADEAFRAAAEADAARDQADKSAGKKSGWLGGWFGGKKDANALPTGPIRAKLGEENSFYYDEDLKKWVNKKAGGSETSTPAAPTPPPPRSASSRVVSSAMGPPASLPPSRVASGMGPPPLPSSASAAGSAPPSRTGTPFSSSDAPPVLAPPNPKFLNGDSARPSSSLSNASSIDDLLAGGPTRSKGNTVKGKKKGGRYVDVMAK